MFEKLFIALLLFVPAAIAAPYLGLSATVSFFLAAIAIIPLAKYIGDATEELATHTNPALGGLLNATFGNATELIIGIFALRAGLIEVVKASITGSIIGNILFVLGTAMLVGGAKREKQTFNRTGALAGSSTLFLGVIALVMPAIFLQTEPEVGGRIIGSLSVLVSVALILMYIASLLFSLHTHKHLYVEEIPSEGPRWGLGRSLLTLLLATVTVGFVSDALVGSIEPLIASFGWTQLFIGVIVIAIVGNAAEHASAVAVARKNRMDLALQITVGSATQITMLIAPVLVLASFLLSHHMDLVFNTFELISIVLSVVIVNMVVADGESNWLEGAQLLAAYAIMAVAFFFHP